MLSFLLGCAIGYCMVSTYFAMKRELINQRPVWACFYAFFLGGQITANIIYYLSVILK